MPPRPPPMSAEVQAPNTPAPRHISPRRLRKVPYVHSEDTRGILRDTQQANRLREAIHQFCSHRRSVGIDFPNFRGGDKSHEDLAVGADGEVLHPGFVGELVDLVNEGVAGVALLWREGVGGGEGED